MVRSSGRTTLTRRAKAIELWPLEKIVPYELNPRVHSDEQVQMIAASIERFGFTNPILVDRRAGIIAGHGRLRAAQRLGLAAVPVIVLDYLSESERRAYLIADNRLAQLADWDENLLAAELAALHDEGFPLDVVGFSDQELAALLDGTLAEGGQEGEDDAPPPPQIPVSRSGDLWRCGDHAVLCGDATRLSCLFDLLGTRFPSMVFTDPPYNVAYEGTAGAIRNDDLGDQFEPFLRAAVGNMVGLVRGALYICMSSSELSTLQRVFTDVGGHWSTFIIWAKSSFTLGRADYQRQYEPILYGWPAGSDHYWCGARDQGDVWQIPRPAANDLHPTMKPVELVRRAVLNSSCPGDLVLDSFGGSGTTMIACEQTRRHARLLELDPCFVDVIVRRWEQSTGRQARLAGTGEAFLAVARARDGGD